MKHPRGTARTGRCLCGLAIRLHFNKRNEKLSCEEARQLHPRAHRRRYDDPSKMKELPMKITITVQPTPGTRTSPKSLEFTSTSKVDLTDAKVLWEFEQFINTKTTSRIHVNLTE